MVSDRTGLPRETVRRRIAELSAVGRVTADEKGNVRLTGDKVMQLAFQQSVADVYSAVERYRKRLSSLAADPTKNSVNE